MEGKYNDNELLFIQEVLDQHGEYLGDLFRSEIEKKKLKVTGDLLNSIEYKVTNFGIDPVLTFSFFSYGRAIEIRWYQRSNNTKKWVTDTNKEVWGINAGKHKRRKKNTVWYAKNLYGSINRLLTILASEYDEHEKARLKGILDHQKIRMQL